MTWRTVYQGIVDDLTTALAELGGDLCGVSNVNASAHVLLLEWPGQPELPRCVIFSKLSQSANGWWGLYVDLYDNIGKLAPTILRVAMFFTGRTRGYVLNQDRVEVQRSRWDQRLSPTKPPSAATIARRLWRKEF